MLYQINRSYMPMKLRPRAVSSPWKSLAVVLMAHLLATNPVLAETGGNLCSAAFTGQPRLTQPGGRASSMTLADREVREADDASLDNMESEPDGLPDNLSGMADTETWSSDSPYASPRSGKLSQVAFLEATTQKAWQTLAAEEVDSFFRAYKYAQSNGDEGRALVLRNKIAEYYQPFVLRIASSLVFKTRLELGDVFQEANIILLEDAIPKYDPQKATAGFEPYAAAVIRDKIKKKSWVLRGMIYIPPYVLDQGWRLSKILAREGQKLSGPGEPLQLDLSPETLAKARDTMGLSSEVFDGLLRNYVLLGGVRALLQSDIATDITRTDEVDLTLSRSSGETADMLDRIRHSITLTGDNSLLPIDMQLQQEARGEATLALYKAVNALIDDHLTPDQAIIVRLKLFHPLLATEGAPELGIEAPFPNDQPPTKQFWKAAMAVLDEKFDTLRSRLKKGEKKLLKAINEELKSSQEYRNWVELDAEAL